MKEIVTFKTQNGNSYFINVEKNTTQYIHPFLYQLILWNRQNENTITQIEKLLENNLDFSYLNKEEINYYYKKYQYLRSNNILTNKNKAATSFSYIAPHNVNSELANLRQLTFEVTDSCNLKCKYCGYGEFYDDYDTRVGSKLPIEKAKQIIMRLAEYWNSNLNKSSTAHTFISFYGGEPLLNMEFIKEVVEFINMLPVNRTFSFSMTTNGILLDKNIDYLVDNNFTLLISLDGDENNNSYRLDHSGNSSFKKVIKCVELIKERYPHYFINNISFNAVLHNKNSVSDIYDFFKTNYNKIPSIGELNSSGIKDEMKEIFDNTYQNSQESLFKAKNKLKIEEDMFIMSNSYLSATIFLNNYSGFAFKDYNDLLFDIQNIRYTPTGSCLPFSKKMFVTVSGKILACERIGQQFELGKIEDVIHLDAESIVKKYNQWYSKFTNQCKECYLKRSCAQCMFQLKNLDDNPKCLDFTNEEKFERFLSNKLNFLETHIGDYARIMNEVIFE